MHNVTIHSITYGTLTYASISLKDSSSTMSAQN